jgi:hypothetical protein
MDDRTLFRGLALFAAFVVAAFLYAMLESALEISQKTILMGSLEGVGGLGLCYAALFGWSK